MTSRRKIVVPTTISAVLGTLDDQLRAAGFDVLPDGSIVVADPSKMPQMSDDEAREKLRELNAWAASVMARSAKK